MQATKDIAIAEVPNNDEYSSLIDDASSLLAHEAFGGHVSPEKVRTSIEAGHLIVAMDKAHGLVGAGILRLTGEATAAITGVAVSPEQRGDGLGTRIISELEKIAEAKQIESVVVLPTSAESEKLAIRLGYQVPDSDLLTLDKSLGTPPNKIA